MKKRITCMLLALCMVLAAVPAAVAAPVVEDQIDVSLLGKHRANESSALHVELEQKVQEETVEPMDTRSYGYATYEPHTSSLDQYRMYGDNIHLELIAHLPLGAAAQQDWNVELFAGAEPGKGASLGMAWGTFNNAQNGDYRISVDIDVNDIKLKPGTYSVMCYTSYDISEDEIYVVEDTMIYFNVYVTNKMALMTRSFLADNSRPGSPEVKKICIARG